MKKIFKIKRTASISLITIFGLTLLFSCSRNLMPPEGMIGEQTVDEQASSKWIANEVPKDTGNSSKPGAEPFSDSKFSDSKFSDSEKEAQIAGLNFKATGRLQDIHFRFDKYDLDDLSRSILIKNAKYLKETNLLARIEIQGHSDERGTNNYNISLAQRRAHSTKIYLVSQGVNAKRIHTISFGEEKPFCLDSNEPCWFKNRRAHFRISG
jgi:peptidoglycan-associated lipoprotein